MIDRDQLREVLAWYDRPPGLAKPPYLDRLVEAARLVVEGREVWWCEPHEVGEPQKASRCWRGAIAADLEERTPACRMVRMILIDGGES